jgi:hypothetical protein
MSHSKLNSWTDHPRLVWLAVFLFHFVLAFPFLRIHHDIPDEDAYQLLAKNLINHHGYYLDFGSFHQKAGEPNTYYAPGWPAVLAGGYLLTHTEIGFWIVSGLAWCLALTFACLLALSFDWNVAPVWVLVVWFSTNPFYVYYHLHLMTETLAIGTGAAILAIGVRWAESPSWRLSLLLGLAAGIGHLTRTALLLPFAAAVLVAFVRVPFRRLLAPGLVCIATYAAVVTPWLLRMRSVGAPLATTEAKLGQNLFLYNYTGVANPYDLRQDERIEFPPGLEDMTVAQRESVLVQRAIAGILGHPGRYLENCLRRVLYLLSPVPNFYAASVSAKMGMACATVLYVYIPWIVVVVLLTKGARLTRGDAVVMLAVVLWYMFHIFLHASVRQRLPSDLWVTVLAISLGQRFVRAFREPVSTVPVSPASVATPLPTRV